MNATLIVYYSRDLMQALKKVNFMSTTFFSLDIASTGKMEDKNNKKVKIDLPLNRHFATFNTTERGEEIGHVD